MSLNKLAEKYINVSENYNENFNRDLKILVLYLK